MYNMDFDQLSEATLPFWNRKTRFKDFLKACIKPLKSLYLSFRGYAYNVLFELTYNGQVIYLEHMLNAVFNGGAPAYVSGAPSGIYIGPGSINEDSLYVFTKEETEDEDKWIFAKSETPPSGTTPVWIYTKEELELLDYDFSVMVPFSVGNVTTNTILHNQIAARVRLYLQAGKRFKILNYTP